MHNHTIQIPTVQNRTLQQRLRSPLLAGALMIVIGLSVAAFVYLGAQDPTPVCGHDLMHHGDICLMDDGSHRSYNSMAASEGRSAWAFVIIGGGVAVSGTTRIVQSRRASLSANA